MPDETVIEKLSSLPGIGVWTAEMLLIFSLCRPDVVSWGDLGHTARHDEFVWAEGAH
jgi:DNA-3-methyladenine glycosylase II